MEPGLQDVNRIREEILTLCGQLPQVDPDIGENILKSITTEDVYRVLRHMKTGSSPGFEGFPTDFYKTFWHIIGSAIVKLFNDITTNVIPASFKQTRLVLIHKRGKDSTIPSS